MGVIANVVKALIQANASSEMILAAVEAMEKEHEAQAYTLDHRKKSDRERQLRKREKDRIEKESLENELGHVMSRDVTLCHVTSRDIITNEPEDVLQKMRVEAISEVQVEEITPNMSRDVTLCHVTPLSPLSLFPFSPSSPPHPPNNPIIPYPNLPIPCLSSISLEKQEFLLFFEAFPQNGRAKGSRRDAEKAFIVARKKDDFEKIMSGVKAYGQYLSVVGQSNSDAHRWLTHERWNDDYKVGKAINIKYPPPKKEARPARQDFEKIANIGKDGENNG